MKKIIRFFRNWDRRALLAAGGGALIVVLVVLLFVLKPFSSGNNFSPEEVIPDNAFAVFRFNNPSGVLHDKETQQTTANLSFLPAINQFLLGLRQADTVFSISPSTKNILGSSKLYVSLHPAGTDKTESLIILDLPEETSASSVYEDLAETGKVLMTEKNIDGSACYVIGKTSFIVYPCKNLIIGSTSERLLGLSIKATEKKSSLAENEDFAEARNKISEDCALNILINAPLLYRSLGQMVSGNTYANLAFLQTLTTWGNMDVNIKDNALVFSGLFPLKSDGQSFLSLFENPCENATPQVLTMLPANTSAAFSFGFSSFNSFFDGYTKRLEKERQNAFDHKYELSHLNEEAKTGSLESCFYSNLKGLLTLFSVSSGPGREPDVFGAFEISGNEEINDCLQKYASDNDWDTANFRGATIYEIPVEYGAYSLFGPLFEPIKETCVAVTDNFVYIGNSVEQLKSVLNDVLSGRTLQTSKYRQNLSNNISTSWNTFAFLNVASASFLLQNQWLSDTSTIAALGKKQSGKAPVISVTSARQSNGIVISGTWFFGESDSSGIYSWTTTLDADISGQPVALKDPETGEYWVAAADVYDNVYLLSSEGAILWKKNTGDEVHSDFHLLWPGNKEKRSIAFSTSKAIYIIGTDGEIRKSFPVTIRSGVSSDMLVADYDNNQNYRLLFCDNNGVFENYSADGKPTAGWNKPETRRRDECKVFYSPLGDKDYLVVSFPDNSVIVYDRKGSEVVRIPDIQFNGGQNPLFGGRNAKTWTAFSTDGAMISIDNNGKISTLTEKSYGENILFAAINDFVFVVSEGSLGILDPSGKELSSEKVSDASIDYLKAVVTGKNSLLVYHNREAAVGIRSAASDKALNEVKTDCDAFDCIVYKNNLILISSSGKTITSETIEPEKAEKPD